MHKSKTKALALISSLAIVGASLLAGCSKTEDSSAPTDSSSSVTQTSTYMVTIKNKDALLEEWIAGDDARDLEISITGGGTNGSVLAVDIEAALKDGSLTISSSDTNVISVSGLSLSPLAEGTATVTATYSASQGQFSDSITISIGNPLSALRGFIRTFASALKENAPSKYGIVRAQTKTLKNTTTTNQISVTRKSKEVLIKTGDDLVSYYGMQGDYYYTYVKQQISSTYTERADVEKYSESSASAISSELKEKQLAQLEGGNLSSGDLSIYFKYDSTNSQHGLRDDYQFAQSGQYYVVKAGFYIEPTSAGSGSGYTFDYTYTLDADYLPVKVEATRLYVNASKWDFETHDLADGEEATFIDNVTFTNFDFSEPAETSDANPLFDVSPYFIASLDSSKVHASVYNSATWSYTNVTTLTVGDSFQISLDEGGFSPSTALDEADVYVTATSDESVISIGSSYEAVGAGECTLTIGTILHPDMATLTLIVKESGSNVGTTDNPVSAYFSSWLNTPDNFKYENYSVAEIDLTVDEGAVQALCKTNQTGVVTFDELSSHFGNDSSICQIAAADYSDAYNAAGSGFFTLTFTPVAAGKTSVTIYTSETEYITIPIVVS